jgi:phosphate-selective porin
LDIKGDITERWDYRTQIDFAGGTTSSTTGAQSYSVKLLDAIIGYKVNPYLKLSIGQQKIPFSQENLASSPKLETINRSQVVEALVARGTDVIGNQNGRDIGIQASGSILPAKAGYNLVDYAFGIFNGAGINSGDTNEQKDFIGRVVYHPLKDWSIGTSYYSGRYTLSSAPARKDDRDRIGAEFAYVKDPISLKGEYIKGNDGATNKDGWYLQAGYFFIPKKFQGVFKFDTYDPNTKLKKNETNVYTLGGNWYFNKWAFLQVNYELKDERGKEIDNNALIGQLTLQF